MNNSPDNTWHPLSFHPPEWFEPFEVRLPDGSVERAVWTGTKWWIKGRTLSPVAWRPIAGRPTL